MSDLPRSLKLATVWLLLGLFVFLGVLAWQREQARTQFTLVGSTIEIRRGPDGHYHWPGRINGREVDFLIDTGATTTAISAALARELGLKGEQRVRSSTAGGMVDGEVVSVDVDLSGGVGARRLRVIALPGLNDRPLLGMDLLGRLQWSQSGGVLRIQGAAK